MRYAILADIHGNFEALTCVWKEVEKRGYDQVIFLGDWVGYGANPNECIEFIKEKSNFIVLGNHDAVMLRKEEAKYFNPYAKEAAMWTRSVLKPEYKTFLKRLPYTLNLTPDILLVHSSPNDPELWEYVYSPSDAYWQFKALKENICFFGHTHVPTVLVEYGEDDISLFTPTIIQVEKNCRYLINPGSVGQPRDRDPRAAYLIFDLDKETFYFYRVEYPIKQTQKKIMEAGLPKFLAERLGQGK